MDDSDVLIIVTSSYLTMASNLLFDDNGGMSPSRRCFQRIGTLAAVALASAGMVPTVSAHGTSQYTPAIPQWVAAVVMAGGLGIIGVTVLLKRRNYISVPEYALAGVFFGAVIAALGGAGVVELSQIETYSVSNMPFSRTWYQPLTLFTGLSIMTMSVIGGRLWWPHRPRYAGLGVLLGSWVVYPAIFTGAGSYTNPVGYLIVISVPLAIGYILWRDGYTQLKSVWSNTTARWFGIGISAVVSYFFMVSINMVSFVPESGVGVSRTEASISTVPTGTPLVTWPAVEIWLPHVPFSGMASVGTLILVGLLGGLMGLTAAVIAHHWTSSASMDMTQSSAGAGGIVGPNACGCCGPMVAEFAVVLVGPSAAQPLYWLFVDLASPVGALFFVISVALLTGGLINSINAVSEPGQYSVPTPAPDS